MAGRAFKDLGCLSPETLSVLDSLGFTRSTPVQEATIPLFCGHKDVAVDACTGSGKTLAFVLPVVERLRRLESPLHKHQVGAVIISPTRELSRQIFTVAEPFVASVPGLSAALLVGGSDPSVDVRRLKEQGGNVLVGTPGRLEDLLRRCSAWLGTRSTEVLVLDEADRLLDMGFRAQLDAIMAALPRQRRTGLFSATQTDAVQALARAGLRNALRVNVAVAEIAGAEGKKDKEEGAASEGAAASDAKPASSDPVTAARRTPGSLNIRCVTVPAADKLAAVAAFIQAHPEAKTIVYFLTCACVDYATKTLPALLQRVGEGPGGRAEEADADPGATTTTTKKQKKKKEEGRRETNESADAGTSAASSSSDFTTKRSTTAAQSASASSQVPTIYSLHGRMKQAAREATLEAFGSAAERGSVLLATDVAARGLDIPDVDWVLQADPPQDPATFVHRVGRTARMGRAGEALLLLLPSEDAYVRFLELRGVPVARATAADVVGRHAWALADASVPAFVRSLSLADRAVMEAGVKAFVSFIRGYKEHQCSFIFRLGDLPMGQLATGFGLLRLPRMPELKKTRIEGFAPCDVDPETVPFRDRAREKQRQALLAQRAREGAAQKKRGREPPRLTDAQRAKREAAEAAAGAGAGARLTAARRRALAAADDAEDLRQEYQALQRLKRGKMSHREFNKVIGLVHDPAADGDGGRLVKAMQQRVTRIKRKQQKKDKREQAAAGSN